MGTKDSPYAWRFEVANLDRTFYKIVFEDVNDNDMIRINRINPRSVFEFDTKMNKNGVDSGFYNLDFIKKYQLHEWWIYCVFRKSFDIRNLTV
jgi:hypothetical protein